MFHSSKETFLQHLWHFLENWIFDENRQARTLQNSENFVLSQNGVRKYFFWQNYLFHSSKETFLQHLRQNWIFEKNDRRRPLKLFENHQARTLQNSENFELSQNGVRKYFLAKLFLPLIKRNISTTFEAVFGKLNFWLKIDRRGPYKIVKILYYLKMKGKYFLAILFVPLIKRNVTTTFKAVFGKFNFWQKIDRHVPYKIVKILYYLKMG